MSTWYRSWHGILVLVILLFIPVAFADTAIETATSLSQKGDLLFSEGRYSEALAAYNASIVQDPYNAVIWNKFGQTQSILGFYHDAAGSFEQAVKLDPYYGTAWVNLGDALESQGKTDESVAIYDRAIALNPNDLHALNKKGAILQVLGKEDEAQKVFEEIIRISDKDLRVHPNDAKYDVDLWNNRAIALSKLGRYREALQAYDQALSINPKYEDALKNKKELLLTLDTRGNVSLPEPPQTVITNIPKTTNKVVPLPLLIPITAVILLVAGMYCRKSKKY